MNYSETSSAYSNSQKTAFIKSTYGWMALGLLLTAIVSYVTANAAVDSYGEVSAFGKFINFGPGIMIFSIAELILVFWLSASIRKISVNAAMIAFLVYSVLNGVTLSSIFFVYKIGSIAGSFFGCSAMFAVMSFYGANTKTDLTTVGKYAMMALIGVIIANVVQLIISLITKRPMGVFDVVVSVITVIIFTALTAYDTQKLVRNAEYANDSDDYKKISIIAALNLYLDFINLFLNILRLFGKRK